MANVQRMSPGVIQPDVVSLSDCERKQIWETINDAFAEYEAFVGKPYVRFDSYEQFIQSLTDLGNHYLFIKNEDEYLAGACYREPTEQSETLYFGTLWVSIKYRNMGLASQLIHILEQEAKRRKLRGLSIQLYRMPQLIEFYQKHHDFVFAIDETRGEMVKYFDCKSL
ncbi:GNAT family N-acetyltransferase [Photobacterium sp. DNB23_23_1]|uniref:GNAT family N-acetyltransferase n=1 Tax=Photobacterium pectinilyticum TaxID=2906793 RepID=A0ABT1N315_9GAMM|nr:GNAT family N-acetyltransferase [Photobacterium sp. ZSDE20]MCQ1059135.1 GNAT family N-acetyltransferase [Photobacterium sp. ZSDE20]MDD1824366.1 GNAT family N-acetyltransferase [Photobacterium sp. ZSDE20]